MGLENKFIEVKRENIAAMNILYRILLDNNLAAMPVKDGIYYCTPLEALYSRNNKIYTN